GRAVVQESAWFQAAIHGSAWSHPISESGTGSGPHFRADKRIVAQHRHLERRGGEDTGRDDPGFTFGCSGLVKRLTRLCESIHVAIFERLEESPVEFRIHHEM